MAARPRALRLPFLAKASAPRLRGRPGRSRYSGRPSTVPYYLGDSAKIQGLLLAHSVLSSLDKKLCWQLLLRACIRLECQNYGKYESLCLITVLFRPLSSYIYIHNVRIFLKLQ